MPADLDRAAPSTGRPCRLTAVTKSSRLLPPCSTAYARRIRPQPEAAGDPERETEEPGDRAPDRDQLEGVVWSSTEVLCGALGSWGAASITRPTPATEVAWTGTRYAGCSAAVADGDVAVDDALDAARRAAPDRRGYDDLGFARVDQHRGLRTGDPEVVYGAGKTPEQVVAIVRVADCRRPTAARAA